MFLTVFLIYSLGLYKVESSNASFYLYSLYASSFIMHTKYQLKRTESSMAWLINAAQLEKFRRSQKSLIILDASLHLPATGRDARKEFIEKHIIDAHFFAMDEFSDPNTDLPHMLIKNESII